LRRSTAFMAAAGSDSFATLVSSLTSPARHVGASIKLLDNATARETICDGIEASNVIVLDDVTPQCLKASLALSKLQRKLRCRAEVAAGRRSAPVRRRARLAGCSATGSFLHRKVALHHSDCERAVRPTHHHIVKPSLAASGSAAGGTADQARASMHSPSGIGHLLSPTRALLLALEGRERSRRGRSPSCHPTFSMPWQLQV
jgi:hypothetical protein